MILATEKFINDFPEEAHFVTSLGLDGIEVDWASKDLVIEETRKLMPSVEVDFHPGSEGVWQAGSTEIRFDSQRRYRPKLRFYSEGGISVDLWMHELGHVCCASRRKHPTIPSGVEAYAGEFIGASGRDIEADAHGEIAAWAAALVLATMLGFNHRVILVGLLTSVVVNHRRDLRMFLDSIEQCELRAGGISGLLENRPKRPLAENESWIFSEVCVGAFALIDALMPWRPDLLRA